MQDKAARYIVGIDLGTSNCCVAYTEAGGAGSIEILSIPQVTNSGEVSTRSTLASCALIPTESEVAVQAMALPWEPAPTFVVGDWARDRGAELPHRLIASAKSWLSHTAVDRTAAILPWAASGEQDDGQKWSPVEASANYLKHIRAAWDHQMDAALAEQDVFLTVPASFDAVARELTAIAANQAGLANITLLEEPQAAFYAWLAHHGDTWRDQLVADDVVLVCDVGGGTSDFSLIAVTDDGAGNLALDRVAVGDHILLGGDNMDLALAHVVAERFRAAGKKLKPSQQRSLVSACRRAKETLLTDDAPSEVPITILGSGSKLIGGTLRGVVSQADVQAIVLDGFAPSCTRDARPNRRTSVGLKELALPYAADPALTRHLAGFLARGQVAPTAILYNGGVMKADGLRDRVASVVAGWFGKESVRALVGTDLDLAVARGAAYYGLVRRGQGVRIRGGTARSYYIGVESAMPAIPGFSPPIKALCVAPFGLEEGSSVIVPEMELGLVVGESAEFRFFASSRTEDQPGEVFDPDEVELIELDALEARLPVETGNEENSAGDVVSVALHTNVTEVGTLEIWCVANRGDGRWKLEYLIRNNQ